MIIQCIRKTAYFEQMFIIREVNSDVPIYILTDQPPTTEQPFVLFWHLFMNNASRRPPEVIPSPRGLGANIRVYLSDDKQNDYNN